MAVVRATQRLARILGLKLQPSVVSAETNKLGEWYANAVESEAGTLVVLINAPTRIVLVSQALDAEGLSRDLPRRLQRLLAVLGIASDIAEREARGLESLTFAKTVDRQMIGSLNEVCRAVSFRDEDLQLKMPADFDATENELASFIHMQMDEKIPVEALRVLLDDGPPKRTLRLVHSAETTAEPRAVSRAPLRVAASGESPLYLPGPLTPDDVARLAGVPLRLESMGLWDPKDEEWGEPTKHLPSWLQSVIAAGKRESFEMEEVASTLDANGNDPIFAAMQFAEAGKRQFAEATLWRLIERDIRCLDAHAHLGSLVFDKRPADALSHYLMGAHIGRYALRGTDRPVVPWIMLGNRPFLRCLNGAALCLWRLKRNDEAAQLMTDMLWLNPVDNQGARFNLERVEAGERWSPDF